MRLFWKISVVAAIVAACGAGLLFGTDGVPRMCDQSESCVREWISATSGWAAVMAAIPTIYYLSKQVRDADQHQRIGFAIQLRRQRILATRTLRIASVALEQLAKQEAEQADADMTSWDRETVEGVIHHLRDGTISAFESEIAHPISVGGWGMALIVERGFSGIEPAVQTAPEIARQYFENLRDQAESYLSEITEITRSS